MILYNCSQFPKEPCGGYGSCQYSKHTFSLKHKTVHMIFTSHFMIFWYLTLVLDAQKKRLIDMVLLRPHNVCLMFYFEEKIDMIINICVGCSKDTVLLNAHNVCFT